MDLRELPGREFRRHPWEVARRRFLCERLQRAGVFAAPRRVLDVGAGDGYVARAVLERLPSGSEVVCFDPNYEPEVLARFAADAPAGLTFTADPPEGSFDVITALDVCEHVEDDRVMLRDITASFAAAGATVLVSVPAHQALYGRHDAALGHYRRYSAREGRALVESAGLRIVDDGGVFYSLLLPRGLTIARERLLTGERPSGPNGEVVPDTLEWHRGRAVTAAVDLALRADAALSRGLSRLPIPTAGLSWWALCKTA